MKKTTVLVVDDEVAIARFISASLRRVGYEVVLANNGEDAVRLAEEENPALILLDINMPGVDGFEVCRRVREWDQVPIVMISARGDEGDKVRCLDMGADDYITKPFGMDELLARVRAVLRRAVSMPTSPTKPIVTCGDLKVDFDARRVTVGDRQLKLTRTEFDLLQELVTNANRVLTHGMLLRKVWGPEYGEEKEYVHVFMGRLRKLIEPAPEHPRYIVTVPGVGYQFRSDA